MTTEPAGGWCAPTKPEHPRRPPRRTVRRWRRAPGWQVRLYWWRNRMRKALGLPTIWPPPYLRPTCDAEPPWRLADAGPCTRRGDHTMHGDAQGYTWDEHGWHWSGGQVALCWCGDAHPVGEWHDPTHGQIDRDLQDRARTMLGLEPGVSHRTHAAITPTELNLQRRRDRGEL